jgi:hypothetical protein
MKNTFKNLGWTALVAMGLFTSCEKELASEGSGNFHQAVAAGFTNPTQNIPVDENGIIQDNFDGNTTDNIIQLSSNKVWLIDGVSFVSKGKTLQIAAGTIISSGIAKPYKANDGSVKNIRGVLVVVKGAKLDAQGTESLPIVFTSPNAPGNRKAGDFGGVILLGSAPTNQPVSTVIEGLPNPSKELDITYGGTNSTDNSGILRYVRIEYAGFELFKDNEINGLTLGGVGSGTTLDHIQVTYSADDSFEFFGGTVNASYLVAAGGDDDDFDFDFGYSGTVQYAVGLKAVNSTHSKSGGKSDANGIESDNEKDFGLQNKPRTLAVLRNLTLLGINDNKSTELKIGARFRRYSSFDLQNSIIAGFPTGVTNEESATGMYANNVLHAFNLGGGAVTPASTAASAIPFLALGTSPFYEGDATSYNVDNLIPDKTSPAAGSPYKGAIDPATTAGNTWLKNWTEFNTKNKVY